MRLMRVSEGVGKLAKGGLIVCAFVARAAFALRVICFYSVGACAHDALARVRPGLRYAVRKGSAREKGRAMEAKHEELLEKLQVAETAEDVLRAAREAGVELTAEQAARVLAERDAEVAEGELSDEALAGATGGVSWTKHLVDFILGR